MLLRVSGLLSSQFEVAIQAPPNAIMPMATRFRTTFPFHHPCG
jgi:hypothetical protein